MASEDATQRSNADTLGPSMTLGEHLEELRRRILLALAGLGAGMVVGLLLSTPIVRLLSEPYLQLVGSGQAGGSIIVTSISSGFRVYLRVALYVGLVLASPWIFYQLWMFIAAGLYPSERRWVTIAVPFSAGLFLAGASFFLFALVRPALRFFLYFNRRLGTDTMIRLDNHISFMTSMMVIFGFCFQLPLAIVVLNRMGLLTRKRLRHYRRHVIVTIAVLAALATPPDPFTQLALAVPMWLLFELGVVLCWLLDRRSNADPA